MLRGLYTGASGMVATQRRMDVISNNLANVATTGFKEQTAVDKAYPGNDLVRTDDDLQQLPMGTLDRRPPIGSLNTGVKTDGTYSNFRQGQFRKTNNPLDMAIEGDGFFVVEQADGEQYYTRDGSFTLNSENELVNTQGARVIGLEGPVQFLADTERVDITGNGQIVDQNNNIVGNLEIAQFEDKQNMQRVGHNLFEAGENNPRIDSPTGFMVRQGKLERSNTDAVQQMIQMIEVNRHHELQSKLIQQQNKLLGLAISRVGRA